MACQDLLDERREAAALAFGRQLVCNGVSQSLQVSQRVQHAIDVIYPQPIQYTVPDPFEDAGVGRGEDGGILHAERDQMADREEASVVDLAGGAPPVGEPVGLGGEQSAQAPGTARVGRRERGQGRLDMRADLRRTVSQSGKLLQQLVGTSLALSPGSGRAARPRRDRAQPGDGGLEFTHLGRAGAALPDRE